MADDAADRIEHHVRRTLTPRVLGAFGGFAGCFRLDFNEKLFQRNYKDPVLVSCTDGVGAKAQLARDLKKFDTIGIDLVAMSVNDLIVQGAEPLFFLDYLSVHKLDHAFCADIVAGVAEGCVQAGAALLGGETAELPDVFSPGDFHLTGFAVGVCEMSRMVDGKRAEAGDVLIGLRSSGVHANGFTLVRKIIQTAGLDMNRIDPELDETRTLGQILIAPSRIYAHAIVKVLHRYTIKHAVTAMSHITGSGLPGNLPRALPENLDARIRRASWTTPPIFSFLQRHGRLSDEEAHRAFNMGIGFVLAVKPAFADSVYHQLRKLEQEPVIIGEVVTGRGRVLLE